MADFFNNLGDGWTIYLWLVTGAMIIVGVVYGIRWAINNEQFDEDIKYLIFDSNDESKMAPEEYAKAKEVFFAQVEKRKEVTNQK